MDKKLAATQRLLTMMSELREQCPWDREQTFESLRNNTIEECYELVDAISSGDMSAVKEELGDLLLHVVFYSKMGEEQSAFDFAEVTNTLCDKLEYRHPHIYGDVEARTTDDVKRNWEELKLRKKKRKGGLFGGVPVSLPAMVKSMRIGSKAASVGFDWEAREDVWAKVKEEIGEIEVEIAAKDQEALEGEFGDLFFALINASRLYGIDAEAALERTNRKFISRFQKMESLLAKEQGADASISDLTLTQMDSLWDRAKSEE
ncbi:MAG: nucleoside triphosphate pyrophosphohydrolase [Rikenellaceae bacterium]